MKIKPSGKLIGLVAAFCLLYFVVDFTGGKKKSKSLRTELVILDTTKIDQIKIQSPNGIVDLAFAKGEWDLSLQQGKKVTASQSAIDNLIFALQCIKPSRVASKSKAEWKDYQVGITGTRVRVYENGEKSLDLVIGRFGMEGQKSYHTFVRLWEDEEVYVANDFMGFSISSDPSSYRDQVLAKIKADSVITITFNYPADSSVRLDRVGDSWKANGVEADSSAVASYLGGLGYVSGKEFFNEENSFASPVLSATFDMTNGESVIFDAYDHNGSYVFHSTKNEYGYFRDEALLTKLFKGWSTFK